MSGCGLDQHAKQQAKQDCVSACKRSTEQAICCCYARSPTSGMQALSLRSSYPSLSAGDSPTSPISPICSAIRLKMG